MAKYKLLTQFGWPTNKFIVGQIYDTDFNFDLKGCIEFFPQDWELVEESKSIKLTLEQAKSMYGKSSEMDELLLANFSKDELTKKELPKSIFELSPYTGYYIHSGEGNIQKLRSTMNAKADINAKHIFATEKQAKSALAAAQLSQLIAVYNDGWEFNPTGEQNNVGYCIYRSGNKILVDSFKSLYHFLSFKSAELRDEFLNNFRPLIKDYLMID